MLQTGNYMHDLFFNPVFKEIQMLEEKAWQLFFGEPTLHTLCSITHAMSAELMLHTFEANSHNHPQDSIITANMSTHW